MLSPNGGQKAEIDPRCQCEPYIYGSHCGLAFEIVALLDSLEPYIYGSYCGLAFEIVALLDSLSHHFGGVPWLALLLELVACIGFGALLRIVRRLRAGLRTALPSAVPRLGFRATLPVCKNK